MKRKLVRPQKKLYASSSPPNKCGNAKNARYALTGETDIDQLGDLLASSINKEEFACFIATDSDSERDNDEDSMLEREMWKTRLLNQFHGDASENPMDHLEDFEEICSTKKSIGVPADYIKCKLFPFSLCDKARAWFKSLSSGHSNHGTNARLPSLTISTPPLDQTSLETRFIGSNKKEAKFFMKLGIVIKATLENVLTTAPLNIASDGNFMTLTVEEAYILINNLAASSRNNCPDQGRTSRSTSHDHKEIEELKAMVKLFLQNQQRSVNVCEAVNAAEINHQLGTQDQTHMNLQSAPKSSPTSQDNKLELMVQPLLIKLQRLEDDVDIRVDCLYTDLNGKFEALSTHVDSMDVQLSQTIDSSKSTEIIDRRIAEVHEKIAQDTRNLELKLDIMNDYLNKNNEESFQKFTNLSTHVKMLEKQIGKIGESVKRQDGHLPGKTIDNPMWRCNVIDTDGEREVTPIPGNQDTEVESPACPEEYDVIGKVPHQRKLHKINDSVKFVFPCIIEGMEFLDSLCDTGANVNVMSKAIATELGMRDIKPSHGSVKFGDNSSTIPYGFVMDLMEQVGGCLVPVDFHILEMENDSPRALIFESSFLASVRAVVDYPNRRVCFSKVKKRIFYPAVCSGGSSYCITIYKEEKLILDPGDNKGRCQHVSIQAHLVEPKGVVESRKSKHKARMSKRKSKKSKGKATSPGASVTSTSQDPIGDVEKDGNAKVITPETRPAPPPKAKPSELPGLCISRIT
ncbi:uncharacterized protein LOC112087320 [Eutrema salsugineum]|uniref:uncharacterized protein LOC112087320 n=1 Tax=Eutrema salsugineum TaxID=72664 RepID=UPI000CED702F|nr:uncharacterized protein LOC112087320 [Eutrema salsugineum]